MLLILVKRKKEYDPLLLAGKEEGSTLAWMGIDSSSQHSCLVFLHSSHDARDFSRPFFPISEDHHLAQVHIGDFSKMSELVPTALERTPECGISGDYTHLHHCS